MTGKHKALSSNPSPSEEEKKERERKKESHHLIPITPEIPKDLGALCLRTRVKEEILGQKMHPAPIAEEITRVLGDLTRSKDQNIYVSHYIKISQPQSKFFLFYVQTVPIFKVTHW